MPFFLAETDHAPGANQPGRLPAQDLLPAPGMRGAVLSAAVLPPQLFSRSRPAWQRTLRRWWARLAGNGVDQDVRWQPMARMQSARDAFFMAAADLRGPAAQMLRQRIDNARSLRELWHLRLDLFNLLAQASGQAAAQAQLQNLNALFPRRVEGPPGSR